MSVIRAFSYFSHLANIAEDRHHVRRRAHERQGHLQAGSLARRFERLARRGSRADRHRAGRSRTPTSRRCSPRTRPRCSARASSTPSARSPSCWRRARPAQRARARPKRGADPRPRHAALADAHAAHRQAHGRRRDRERAELLPLDLPAPDPAAVPRARGGPAGHRIAPFFRMGNWIGGDRDGNPFVTAGTLPWRWRGRARRCCATT